MHFIYGLSEKLINGFNELQERFKYQGQNLYWMQQDSCTRMGDESLLRTIIWEGTEPADGDVEARYEFDDNMTFNIEPMIQGLLDEDKNWTKDASTPGILRAWTSNAGDYIRLQFSDHCIYLIILASGQY